MWAYDDDDDDDNDDVIFNGYFKFCKNVCICFHACVGCYP